MKKRVCWAFVTAALAVAVVGVSSASAATVVGTGCAADIGTTYSIFTLANPSGPNPTAVPAAGVITSWSVTDSFTEEGLSATNQQLKIYRPTVVAKTYSVAGESPTEPISLGPNTFATRIPVKTGDVPGLAGVFIAAGEPILGSLYCENTAPTGARVGAIVGNPPAGSSVTISLEAAEAASPVTVAVEPDADGDGYGDETQDQCPTDASTQGPCPVKAAPSPPPPPAAPITLSASAAAKKGLVTVTVTSSAQASVTLAGTVKLGKGQTVKLSGGTQTVTPGALAKFIVLFPAKLKARLKQLPPSQKLTLSFSASAPGATTTSLTVKVPGQARPVHHKHKPK